MTILMDEDFRDGALENVEELCAQGSSIVLSKPGTKDEFGEETGTPETLTLMAYPIRYSPFNRSIINKVAWATEVDVLIYVSKKAVTTLGHDYSSLGRFKNIKIGGLRFDQKYVKLHINVGNDFLYFLIGGIKA